MDRISCKKHIINGELLLAVCDFDLLGKEFEEGNVFLSIKKNFYFEEKEYSNDEIINLLKQCKHATIAGKNAVNLTKKTFSDITIQTIKQIPFTVLVKG